MSYFTRVQAERRAARQAKEKAESGGESMAGASQYEITLVQLTAHRRQLSDFRSRERKIELKQQFLPEYDAYITGVLDADAGVQDDVLMTLMVWHIDVGSYARGLQIAEYALQHDLVLPEQFRRNVATLVAEDIAEGLLANQDTPDASARLSVDSAISLTQDHDMPDEVRAKLYKAAGEAWQEVDLPKAVGYYERTFAFDRKSGVKTILAKLHKQIATEAAAAASETDEVSPTTLHKQIATEAVDSEANEVSPTTRSRQE